jgi:endonuclease/exonuclease/phosphatase family metal-dependent hydrolase
MRYKVYECLRPRCFAGHFAAVRLFPFKMAAAWLAISSACADFVEQVVPTNAVVRVMAANLNGNAQSYQPFALRIFRGLKPDIVAINEFNYAGNTAADFRFMVTNTFGTNYVYFREAGGGIPNGVISRWPIIASGEWDDPTLSDRDFAWARIDVPGPHDLFVISVHLKASGGSESQRQTQATQLRTRVQADFPAGAYVVIAGDFNLQSRSAASEPALTVFGTFMRDAPIPTDQQGDPDTNNGRSRPYDVIVQSPTLTTNVVPVRIGSQSFASGLVFDSRVFNPLADVAPVLREDSGLAQHMAVVKDYRLNYTVTNRTGILPPRLTFADGELRWNSPTGLAWRVESTSNLVQWTPLATNAASTTNRMQSVATEGFLARFLRLILQQ